MAKYEDYAKRSQVDELDTEIDEAAKAADERREDADNPSFELPDRFKGKSAEEIARSYVELEQLNSRQAQSLGQMRKTVDDLLTLQLRESADTRQEKPEVKPVTAEDLYDEPDQAIRNVVRQETDARVKSLEEELANERMARATAEFTKKFPEWQNDVKDAGFVEWIKAKPHRISLAQRADKGDFGAAEELFGTYYDFRDVRKQREDKEARKQKVKAATLETPGAEVPEQEETLSRTALMEKRIAAKRGDSAARRWLQANAERIAIAYEEKRVVD